jgi:hypothetical protein
MQHQDGQDISTLFLPNIKHDFDKLMSTYIYN